MKTSSRLLLSALAALALLAGAADASACATCFGQSDAPMARGMNMGIMVLLAFIGLVLAGIVSFFVYVAKRTAAHEAREAAANGADSNDFPTEND